MFGLIKGLRRRREGDDDDDNDTDEKRGRSFPLIDRPTPVLDALKKRTDRDKYKLKKK